MAGVKKEIDFYRGSFSGSIEDVTRMEELMSMARQHLDSPKFELRIIAPSDNGLDRLMMLGAGTGLELWSPDMEHKLYTLDMARRRYVRHAADGLDEMSFYLTDNAALEVLNYARDREHPAAMWPRLVSALYKRKGTVREFMSMLTDPCYKVKLI